MEIASYASGVAPEKIAADIGNGGAGKLKEYLTESLNTYFRPLRAKRAALEKDMGYVRKSLDKGIEKAREVGAKTLMEVRIAMNMYR